MDSAQRNVFGHEVTPGSAVRSCRKLSHQLMLLFNYSARCRGLNASNFVTNPTSGSSQEHSWAQRRAQPKHHPPWCRHGPWADWFPPLLESYLTAQACWVCRGCFALRCVGIFLVLSSFFLQMQDWKPQQQQKAILLDLFRTRNIATITIMSLLLW